MPVSCPCAVRGGKRDYATAAAAGDYAVTSGTLGEQKLEARKDWFMVEFIRRPRFPAGCTPPMPFAEYVQKLTRNAGISDRYFKRFGQ